MIWRWTIAWAWLLAVGSPLAAPSLQALIDTTPAGATLRVPAGVHAGPVHIDKPMTLDGGGQA